MTQPPLQHEEPTSCHGQFLRLRGTTAPLCYRCVRYGQPGPQMLPEAAYTDASDCWDCVNFVPLGEPARIEDAAAPVVP